MKNRQVWVDIAKPEHATEAEQFFKDTKDNLVDPDVFTYPATKVLRAHKDKKTQVYVPLNLTFMIESLAINPHNSELDTALALKQLMQVIRYQAKELGMGELNFLCKDASTIQFAEHNGFEQVSSEEIKLYRMKI
jgi:hypothetical protein